MKVLHMIAFTLLVIGGLNWGIFGATNMHTNVVHSVLGSIPWLEMLVYILVGLSAIYEAATHMSHCKMCGSKGTAPMNNNQPAM